MDDQKRIANNAIGFLMRADLKGHEVPAFIEVVEALKETLAAPVPDEAGGAQEPGEALDEDAENVG